MMANRACRVAIDEFDVAVERNHPGFYARFLGKLAQCRRRQCFTRLDEPAREGKSARHRRLAAPDKQDMTGAQYSKAHAQQRTPGIKPAAVRIRAKA
jgi:hypothetical protein